jgi:hypothetical protein
MLKVKETKCDIDINNGSENNAQNIMGLRTVREYKICHFLIAWDLNVFTSRLFEWAVCR